MARTVTLTETLQDIVRLLVDAAHPTKIILFWSRARGEQTSDSDLDLIVVLPQTMDRFTGMVRLRRALKPIRMPIDILVYSEEEVASRGHYPGTALGPPLLEPVRLSHFSRTRTFISRGFAFFS